MKQLISKKVKNLVKKKGQKYVFVLLNILIFIYKLCIGL